MSDFLHYVFPGLPMSKEKQLAQEIIATLKMEFVSDDQRKAVFASISDRTGSNSSKRRIFSNNKEATDWGFDQKSINPEISKQEKIYLTDYKVGQLRNLNECLRSNTCNGNWSNQTKTLDNVIERTSIPEDILAYRGIPANILPEEDLVGDIISDKAFLSVTIDRALGEKYASWGDEFGGGKGLVEIEIPKGSRGIWMETFWKDSGESEILLPRNQSLQVVSDEMRGDVRVIRARIIQ